MKSARKKNEFLQEDNRFIWHCIINLLGELLGWLGNTSEATLPQIDLTPARHSSFRKTESEEQVLTSHYGKHTVRAQGHFLLPLYLLSISNFLMPAVIHFHARVSILKFSSARLATSIACKNGFRSFARQRGFALKRAANRC